MIRYQRCWMRFLPGLLLALGFCQSASAASHKPKLDPIAAQVLKAQPRRGAAYARRVSRAIRQAARSTGVSATVIAATASIESDFSMSAGPCIGIMQVHAPTLREMRRKNRALAGLDPDDLEDNIRLGAIELRQHLASRGGSLRGMWGRYNGAGPNSHYVQKAMKAYQRIAQR